MITEYNQNRSAVWQSAKTRLKLQSDANNDPTSVDLFRGHEAEFFYNDSTELDPFRTMNKTT